MTIPLRAISILLAGALLSIPADARRVEITVLHTTDLHGHVLPTSDYDHRENVGGLLRCATLIERIRQERPNVLLVDCGDLFQGSIESLLTEGRIMTRALEWLRYDAWILGNHEFDWGLGKLGALHDRAAVPMLAANITTRPGAEPPLPRVRPFLVKDVEGVRIALVGLITPGVPTWSRPDLLGDCLFERSVEALRRVMPAIRQAHPDVLLLATHQGYRSFGDDHANEINAIAHAFPEIDVIIGGHSHKVMERETIGPTLYTQAGYYGVWLGQLDLVYDTDERRLVRREARVHDVGDAYARHAGLEAALGDDLRKAEAYAAQEVGAAREAIGARPDLKGRSPVQMLLCRAIAAAVDADVVLHGALAEDNLEAGPLRRSDIWRVVPYENRIGIAQLTPEEIAEILEENAQYTGQLQFMGTFGLDYRLDAGAPPGRRIRDIRFENGRPPHARKRLRVALNSYVLASGGLRFNTVRRLVERPEARLELTKTDTRTAVLNYVRRHSPLSVDKLMGGAGR